MGLSVRNAIPATIAILDGRIKVGLTTIELEKLSEIKAGAVKTSRRDMAYVLANKLSGGTTVAGTLMVASMLGIKIFATGGIGGVHRDFNSTLDVSADLAELGRSPVAVVCAGVKSILDIPRTLEQLETNGVLVATYQSENNEFPAFYTRRSGVKVPYGFQSAQEAAKVINAALKLDMKSGILIGVPIPKEFAMDEAQINDAIQEALKSAESQGVTGKEVTPFILSAVAKITQGRSLETNIALIKNNAKVASEIAVRLHEITHQSINLPDGQFLECNDKIVCKLAPVIVGGSNVDNNFRISHDNIEVNGSTYPANSNTCCGGVGRNLAEGISKIFGGSTFISAVGDDQNGQFIKKVMNSMCRTRIVTSKYVPTANCTVMFNENGECLIMAMDKSAHYNITPELILQNMDLFKTAPLIVFDSNLTVQSIKAIMDISQLYNRPLLYEPTDMHIADKPLTLLSSYSGQLKFATPNYHELRTMAHFLGYVDPYLKKDSPPPFVIENLSVILVEVSRMAQFMSDKIENLIITLGSFGVVVGRFDSASSSFFDHNGNYNKPGNDTYQLRYYPTTQIVDIVNVSGAGDSFASGFIAAMLKGLPEEVCMSVAYEAAARALQSKNAVADFYFDHKHECWSTAKPFQPLKLY